VQELVQARDIVIRERFLVPIEEALEDQVVLEQAPPGAPAQSPAPGLVGLVARGHQTARLTISSLILPIALVGLSPFGHTSTQFMIEWQRNSRYGSSRSSRRSLVAWS